MGGGNDGNDSHPFILSLSQDGGRWAFQGVDSRFRGNDEYVGGGNDGLAGAGGSRVAD